MLRREKLKAVSVEQSSDGGYVLDEQIGFLLRVAMQNHTAIFTSQMIEGLTQTQFASLAKLYEVGPCSQNHLGRLIFLDAATIKGVVGGVVGANAAKIGAGFHADITILDVNMDRLRYLDDIMPANVNCLYSDRHTIRQELRLADLVVGAVLIPGALAPNLVTREDLKLMKPGSVIIDVAIDQGGCVETSRPTTHSDPTYLEEGVLHYCVTNMPGAVGRTSTFALCNVTLPWVLLLAKLGPQQAIRQSPPLASSANIVAGKVTNQPVAETFGLKFEPLL